MLCSDPERNPGYTQRRIGRDVDFPNQFTQLWRTGILCGGREWSYNSSKILTRTTTRSTIRPTSRNSLKFLTCNAETTDFGATMSSGIRFALEGNRDETRTGPSRSSWIDRIASCSNRFTHCARFTLNLLLRRFSTPHVVYIRGTAAKRCQWKGNRPRGGFRLPWARCWTNPWDG
jgi:hypothetical protein